MSDIMLVGIDGSECCQRAAQFAATAARASDARLTVVYVIEWSPYSFNTPEENAERHKRREEEIERARKQVLEPTLAMLADTGVSIDGAVRHGHAAEILAKLAAEPGVRQLFIGRRGHSGLKSLLFGSVASKLVQISPIPVTVVP
jgi:nucleotide-binding universal stress UspA family protein